MSLLDLNSKFLLNLRDFGLENCKVCDYAHDILIGIFQNCQTGDDITTRSQDVHTSIENLDVGVFASTVKKIHKNIFKNS